MEQAQAPAGRGAAEAVRGLPVDPVLDDRPGERREASVDAAEGVAHPGPRADVGRPPAREEREVPLAHAQPVLRRVVPEELRVGVCGQAAGELSRPAAAAGACEVEVERRTEGEEVVVDEGRRQAQVEGVQGVADQARDVDVRHPLLRRQGTEEGGVLRIRDGDLAYGILRYPAPDLGGRGTVPQHEFEAVGVAVPERREHEVPGAAVGGGEEAHPALEAAAPGVQEVEVDGARLRRRLHGQPARWRRVLLSRRPTTRTGELSRQEVEVSNSARSRARACS